MSLLNQNTVPYLPRTDQFIYFVTERAAHAAAMSLAEHVRESLPARMKNLADGIAMVALFTAFGRLVGERLSPERGEFLVDHIEDAAESEIGHWRDRATARR